MSTMEHLKRVYLSYSFEQALGTHLANHFIIYRSIDYCGG